MADHSDKHACKEYNELSRRSFLTGTTAATVAATLGYSWLPRFAFGAGGSNRDILISIFLRGGSDGCTICVPHGDSGYYSARPNIAVPPPGSGQTGQATDLDGFFGLPAEMLPLLPAWQNGHLAIVHAVGSQTWSRSHFDAQAWMEISDRNNPTNTTGWLGRHLATSPEMVPGAPIRGIALNYGMVRTMNGGPKSLPIPDPANFDYFAYYPNKTEMVDWLQTRYNRMRDAERQAVRDTNATISFLNTIDFENYAPGGGATYPETNFGYALKSVAAMMRANIGLEAAHVDIDGWDTHANQGSVGGYMAALMDDLGKSLGALYTDLAGSNRLDFTCVVISEFGRNVLENGSLGSDHGAGNAMMVLGGSVNGGQVYGTWPGCAQQYLLDGYDLQMTTDYRRVLAEVVDKRLKNGNLGAIFPDFTPAYLGICQA